MTTSNSCPTCCVALCEPGQRVHESELDENSAEGSSQWPPFDIDVVERIEADMIWHGRLLGQLMSQIEDGLTWDEHVSDVTPPISREG